MAKIKASGTWLSQPEKLQSGVHFHQVSGCTAETGAQQLCLQVPLLPPQAAFPPVQLRHNDYEFPGFPSQPPSVTSHAVSDELFILIQGDCIYSFFLCCQWGSNKLLHVRCLAGSNHSDLRYCFQSLHPRLREDERSFLAKSLRAFSWMSIT